MYYPVLRGKQFELIALRELSSELSPDSFCPIIEPVRNKLQALCKTISFLNKAMIEPIIIVNPNLGDFADQKDCYIEPALHSEADDIRFMPCFSTKGQTTESLYALIKQTSRPFAIFVEEGLNKDMLPILSDAKLVITAKYQRAAFKNLSKVVVIEDSFSRASRNSDYPERSYFSDHHTDFQIGKNVCGFGDYTITGNDFLEGGGPAYVVTIHLSYIDPEEFDSMYIRHFKSFDDRSPTRPGEKFGDALTKLVEYCDSHPKEFVETLGLKGFRNQKSQDHFPGLGQVKKLSIQHHIETLANYGK